MNKTELVFQSPLSGQICLNIKAARGQALLIT